MNNRHSAHQALERAAEELKALESRIEKAELYFAFILLNGPVSCDHYANDDFHQAIVSGEIAIIQDITSESRFEFCLGTRDEIDRGIYRPMTSDELKKFKV